MTLRGLDLWCWKLRASRDFTRASPRQRVLNWAYATCKSSFRGSFHTSDKKSQKCSKNIIIIDSMKNLSKKYIKKRRNIKCAIYEDARLARLNINTNLAYICNKKIIFFNCSTNIFLIFDHIDSRNTQLYLLQWIINLDILNISATNWRNSKITTFIAINQSCVIFSHQIFYINNFISLHFS